jgi:chromate transporter
VRVWLLFLLLLKASVTAFSGLSSLPVVRDDLVVKRQALTDRQLNTALVVGRATPGPLGLYIVSVGYFAAGALGALAAWIALVAPALLVIPLMRYVGPKAESPRAKAVVEAVDVASAGLLLSASLPLATGDVAGVVPVLIVIGSFVLLVTTRVDTTWVILGSVVLALVASLLHLL